MPKSALHRSGSSAARENVTDVIFSKLKQFKVVPCHCDCVYEDAWDDVNYIEMEYVLVSKKCTNIYFNPVYC